jgi:hypothetical protein
MPNGILTGNPIIFKLKGCLYLAQPGLFNLILLVTTFPGNINSFWVNGYTNAIYVTTSPFLTIIMAW